MIEALAYLMLSVVVALLCGYIIRAMGEEDNE
jgi:hypothetical protein